MKTTLNKHDFIEAFVAHRRYDQFGAEALEMIFDYFEEIEADTGEETELDVIAICCEYSADTVEDVASNYDIDISEIEDDDEKQDKVLDYLNDNTLVVGTTPDGKIVYTQF